MKPVELYARVRYACQVEGLSQRETARRFGIDTKTVRKMLAFSVPPGYRRSKPPARPKLDPFTPIIDSILEADRSAPPKQRHTAKRIYERLRDEHAYAGGYTTVKDYVREQQARTREVFVPLVHPPGHAQVDFGEAVAVIGGVRQAIHLFCLDLPHSDAGFVKAYPAERTEAFLDGHVSAFSFLGGVPRSILYDNTKLAVARILGDGQRERTRSFAELQSHYLFLDRFGRPGKGNDKGKVEEGFRVA
jgi:transposase